MEEQLQRTQQEGEHVFASNEEVTIEGQDGVWVVDGWDAQEGQMVVRKKDHPEDEIHVAIELLHHVEAEPESNFDLMRLELQHWQEDLEQESPTLNLLEAAHINAGNLPGEEISRLQKVMYNALKVIRTPTETLPVVANPLYLAAWVLLSSAMAQEQMRDSYKAVSFVCNYARRSQDKDIRKRAEDLWDQVLLGYKGHLTEIDRQETAEVQHDLRLAA